MDIRTANAELVTEKLNSISYRVEELEETFTKGKIVTFNHFEYKMVKVDE